MKILISQTASLGDVILSTPVISALRRNYPNSELWFLSSSAGVNLLRSDNELAGVISYDKKGIDRGFFGFIKKIRELRKHKFDLVFAIQRSARVSFLLYFAKIVRRVGFKSSALPFLFTHTVHRLKAKHDVERNLSILANEFSIIDSDKELRLFAPDASVISSELKGELVEPYISIFPGSLWYTKRWNAGNFAELAKGLSEAGIRSIFLGSENEKELLQSCVKLSNSLSLAGKTNLQELIYVVSNSKVVVCNDSSSLHVASAFKIPTVSIFCATSPQMGFGPWRNPNSEIIEEKNLWCRPCSRHGSDFCPTGTELCMKGTESGASVQAVLNAVLRAYRAHLPG